MPGAEALVWGADFPRAETGAEKGPVVSQIKGPGLKPIDFIGS